MFTVYSIFLFSSILGDWVGISLIWQVSPLIFTDETDFQYSQKQYS